MLKFVMAKKERLQKELDLLLEKIRFLKNSFLLLISSIIGLAFGTSQGKISQNLFIYILSFLGMFILVFIVIRISNTQKKYIKLLDELERND